MFSNQKVPYKACKVSKPASYKNAQHQNQLRCWSTEAPVLFVFINVFAVAGVWTTQGASGLEQKISNFFQHLNGPTIVHIITSKVR